MTSRNLKNLFENSLDFYKKCIGIHSSETLSRSEKKIRWVELLQNEENVFDDMSFLLYALEALKDAETSTKYSFLRAHHELLTYGVIEKKSRSMISLHDEKMLFVSSSEEIFGPVLVSANAQQIELISSFDPSFYPKPPGENVLIRAYEYAPIIEAWFEMWNELKEEWKNSFDQNYFAKEIYEEPAYKKFLLKREAIIDDLLAKGRLLSKTSFSR